jgi:hypothetical protein
VVALQKIMLILSIASLLVGCLLAEIAQRVVRALWLRRRLSEVVALLQLFHHAVGDDARQMLLLRAGLATLTVSLMGLTLCVAVAALVWLPPWSQRWNEHQQLTYLVALSVVATLWWYIRSRQQAATDSARLSGFSDNDD